MPQPSKRTHPARRCRTTAGNFAETIAGIVDHVLGGCTDEAPIVVIGPLVWRPGDDGKRLWYFIVASAGPDFRCDQIGSSDEAFADECRWALITDLAQRRPIVVHDMGDELQMAQWSEAIWPCPKTQQIREDIEAERRQRARPQ